MGLLFDIGVFADSLSGLRSFMKDKVTLEESIEHVQKRLESREENFINVLESIYKNKSNPYFKIFNLFGYGFKDIKDLAESSGLEGALNHLASEGAYLTIDEFKGKREWARKGKSIKFSETEFDNSGGTGFEMSTGGTRSHGTKVLMDFEQIMDDCYDAFFSENIHKVVGYPQIIWFPTSLTQMLAMGSVKRGENLVGCYSQTAEMPRMNLTNAYPSLRRLLSNRALIYEAMLLGAKIPKFEFIGLNECTKIAEQVSHLTKEHSKCFMVTFTSSALRVCRKATELGLEIDGAVFRCTGEPITPTRRREMEAAGAEVIPYYAASETGGIADGCPNNKHCDEMHFLKDSFAVIQYKREVKDFGVTVDAFLLTTLLKSSRKMMINVEMGDYGVLKSESCSCGYGKFGFEEKMHDVRSFEKLTGEGMTLIGTELVSVLEEDLPPMFGGSSTDYQVVEDEDKDGFTHMDILVSPALGKLDERKVVEAVYEGLRKRSKGRNLSFEVWESAGTLRIRREGPIVTRGGKIFSFQVNKKKK